MFCTLTLPADVVEGLWRGYDVERRRDGAALLEVGDPQLGARELPLGVRLLLGGQSLALDQDQPEPTRHEICKRCTFEIIVFKHIFIPKRIRKVFVTFVNLLKIVTNLMPQKTDAKSPCSFNPARPATKGCE